MADNRPGKTQRMIDYAIGAARQGREIAVIVGSANQRAEMYQKLRAEAKKQGCAWVVGDADSGGANGNIEVYQTSHALVMEGSPGEYSIRSNRPREIVVDHAVFEGTYRHVLEEYLRWL